MMRIFLLISLALILVGCSSGESIDVAAMGETERGLYYIACAIGFHGIMTAVSSGRAK